MIGASVMREFGAPMFQLIYYDIMKLHHQYVSGRSLRCCKSEFVNQLLSLKRFIMTNPPERIVWFYGRHQPDLFCSYLHEGLPINIEVIFDRSK